MIKLEKKEGYKYHNVETDMIVDNGYIPTGDKDVWVLVTTEEAEEIERLAAEKAELENNKKTEAE